MEDEEQKLIMKLPALPFSKMIGDEVEDPTKIIKKVYTGSLHKDPMNKNRTVIGNII